MAPAHDRSWLSAAIQSVTPQRLNYPQLRTFGGEISSDVGDVRGSGRGEPWRLRYAGDPIRTLKAAVTNAIELKIDCVPMTIDLVEGFQNGNLGQ